MLIFKGEGVGMVGIDSLWVERARGKGKIKVATRERRSDGERRGEGVKKLS